mmetsp:Transcript_113087/g.330540  ORF Transcript_113087/g.330540 Transcript_113087/m.330540 type:complete len:221 (+) Transcript_113087:74-736(+)
MKKNTGVIRAAADLAGPSADAGPARRAAHPGVGSSGQEAGLRTGMVEAVDGVSVCFTCQQVGHITRFCPMRMGQAVSDGKEEDKAWQDDRKRRDDDRNEFLNAMSQVTASAPPASRSSALAAGAQESKATKLPTFMAVKRRKGQEAAPATEEDASEGTRAAIGEEATQLPTSSGRDARAPSDAKSAAADAGGAAKPAAGLGGLGAYASSSEEEDEEEDEA